jgi:16S rRNA C967 or C1407 C5-methylase (RsmB/RsmF family)
MNKNQVVKLAEKLLPPNQQAQFIESLINPNPVGAIINLKGEQTQFNLVNKTGAYLETPDWLELIVGDQSVGKSKEHESGAIYCLDGSSALLIIWALNKIMIENNNLIGPKAILDLCAAPGGKGIIAWRYLQPKLLVANEVIGKRLPMLISNLKRCGVTPTKVTNWDSARFSEYLPNSFDIVLVDAPCSGQSINSKGAFHQTTVNANSNRQKRILANAINACKPRGHIIYLTCTFSKKENESVIDWAVKKFVEVEALDLASTTQFRSTLTTVPCYRLWPHYRLGLGGFVAVLQKKDLHSKNTQINRLSLKDLKSVWQSGFFDE